MEFQTASIVFEAVMCHATARGKVLRNVAFTVIEMDQAQGEDQLVVLDI
jgi:hypothetical protein